MSEARRSPWDRPILGPLILVALGVLLLLNNLGIVPWDIWQTLIRFWPLLLVLLGAELLLTGRASWGSAFVAVAVVLVVGAIVGASFWPFRPFERPAGTERTASVAQPLEGATQAEIDLAHGAGRLDVRAGAREGFLAEGELLGDPRLSLESSYRVTDGVGRLDMRLRSGRGIGVLFGDRGPHHLDLRLADHLPIRRLEVATGAADSNLDLTGLQLTRLEVNTGASNVLLRLPDSGVLEASVNAGAAGIEIEIPDGMAARIRFEGGLAGVHIDEQRFPQVRGEGLEGLAMQREYRSPDYATADNRVELRIAAGAASVTVR